MKIWFPVIKGGSGSDIYTKRLSTALQTFGIETIISWFDSRYQFAPSLLRKVPIPEGTDIIHANSWNGFAFKRNNIPLVITEHQGIYNLVRPHNNLAQKIYHAGMIRHYVKASIDAAAAIIAVSQFTARGIKGMSGLDNIDIIHNWIDTEVYSNYKSNQSQPEDTFKLLFIGKLTKLKGADLLPKIMQQLGNGFELSIAQGTNARKPGYQVINTKFLGAISNDKELISAYHISDAVIIPSIFEGFGYVALEAMACGKPVISTDTTAIPEVVKDSVTGILCPPRSTESFVESCRFLRDNRSILNAYGRAGRIRAEQFFSEKRIVPKYLSLYEKVLGR